MANFEFFDLEGTEQHVVNANVAFKINKKLYVIVCSYDILKDEVWLQISDSLLSDCKNQLINKVKEKCLKIIKKEE